ncbi:hypothetical protein VZT92_003570 [Zoarces viviparus]|uniref:Uncharacterized protein n=1 Tax=Zoarces viviparus TaxID=48416 RepID=A0AAW1FUJ7_ZOAVI
MRRSAGHSFTGPGCTNRNRGFYIPGFSQHALHLLVMSWESVKSEAAAGGFSLSAGRRADTATYSNKPSESRDRLRSVNVTQLAKSAIGELERGRALRRWRSSSCSSTKPQLSLIGALTSSFFGQQDLL